jgi:hypothetical protein
VGSRLRIGPIVARASLALAGACGSAPAATSAGVQADGGATCPPATLADPEFASPTSWTPARGAALAPGAVTFGAAGICDLAGVTQALPAAPLACARPLVLSFDASLTDDDRVSFAVGIGGGWNLPVLLVAAQTVKLCLGANVFGSAAPTLFLGPGTNPWVCPPPDEGGPAIVLSRVSLGEDVQGTCPLSGIIPGGDFEAGAPGWTLTAGDAVAEIAPGLGENGSAALHLAATHSCEAPSARGVISLPSPALLASPALRVWSKGSPGAVASIRVGTLVPTYYTGATYLPGTDAAEALDVCLPRWAQGTVQPLQLAFVSTRFTEDCVADEPRDFVFDDLAFVSQPGCVDDAGLFDPGFEQALAAPGLAPVWALERYDDQPSSTVAIATDGSTAHTGRAGARFTESSPCPNASLSATVTMPASAGAAGPALHLWYETNTGTHTGLEVSMNAFSAPVPLPPSATWTRATVCLDPRLAGRPEILRVTLTNVSGDSVCADQFPEETVGLDDLDLGTDPTCPAM